LKAEKYKTLGVEVKWSVEFMVVCSKLSTCTSQNRFGTIIHMGSSIKWLC